MPDGCIKQSSALDDALGKLEEAIQTLSVNVEKTVQRCRPLTELQVPGCANDSARPSCCEVVDRLNSFTDRVQAESDKLDSMLSRLKM